MPHTSHPPRSPLINAHLRRYEIQSLCEVFIADPVTTWPKSGVKQTLVDNLDTKFSFTYKFVYGNNLNADGATEDDDARRGVLKCTCRVDGVYPTRTRAGPDRPRRPRFLKEEEERLH